MRRYGRKPASVDDPTDEEIAALIESPDQSLEDVAEPSVDTAAKESKANQRAAAKAMAQTTASGGDSTDVAASGLMASGNPYAMAGGAGLAVLSMQQKRKDAFANQEWQAKQARLERQQSAISRLMNVSNSLRNL